MFGSICPCGIEGFAWLDKREIFVLSDSACIYECAGQREMSGGGWMEVCRTFNIFLQAYMASKKKKPQSTN